MDVNMYLKHVMIDMAASGCKWLQVVARGCANTH